MFVAAESVAALDVCCAVCDNFVNMEGGTIGGLSVGKRVGNGLTSLEQPLYFGRIARQIRARCPGRTLSLSTAPVHQGRKRERRRRDR